MADSLVIANSIELIGMGTGPVVSTNPACAGATFWLQPGFDLSSPQPTTDYVGSLILDGERPFGRRASNRTITLPIEIAAPDFPTLAAAREVLLSAIDQQTWTLQWTRDVTGQFAGAGLLMPVLFDCFRAHASVWTWGGADTLNRQPVGTMTISFDTLPYARSATPVSVAFASPIVGGTAAPAPPVVVDSYAAVNCPAVQSAVAKGTAGTATVTLGALAGTVPTGTGHCLVAVIASGTATVSGITLGGGADHWASATSVTDGGGNHFSIWTDQNAAAGQTAVVVTFSGSTTFTVRVYEFAGVLTSSAVDITQSQTGSAGTAWTTGSSAVQSQVNEISVALTGMYGSSAPVISPTSTRWVNTADTWGTAGSIVSGYQVWGTSINPAGVTYIGTNNPVNTQWAACEISLKLTAAPAIEQWEPSTQCVVGPQTARWNPMLGPLNGSDPDSDNDFDAGMPAVYAYPAALQAPANFLNTAGSGSVHNDDFEGTTGTWTTTGNCVIAGTSAAFHTGASSLQLTSSAAGNMSAGHCLAANIATQGMACTPGALVTTTAWFQATTAARTCQTGATFYNSSGALISVLVGTGTADNNAAVWTQVTGTVTAPALAAWCRATVLVASAGAAGEVHYVDDVYMALGAVAPFNLTGQTGLTLWAGFGTAWWNSWHKGPATFAFTLTDTAGTALSFSRTVRVVASNNPAIPAWQSVTAAIPQTSETFLYGSVQTYSLSISNAVLPVIGPVIRYANVYLDALTAVPQTSLAPASIRGNLVKLYGVTGTARTQVALQAQQASASAQQQAILTGTGTWNPPAGVTSVLAECIGGGGSGSSWTSAGLGGGGGGGEYAAEPAYPVTPGIPVAYSAGAPGSAGASSGSVSFIIGGSASWTVPSGVSTIKVECWGAGGGAGDLTGGAGGGEYAAEASLAVTAGKVYSFTVGKGGPGRGVNGSGAGADGGNTVFAGDAVTVTAHGGKHSVHESGTGGAGGTGSSNTTHSNGGAGGTSVADPGGGGGGSASAAGAGNTGGNATSSTGGTGAVAIAGGGAGGAGTGTGNIPGYPGGNPGGGGGAVGVNNTKYNGGSGADGQVIITYTIAGGSPVNGGTTLFGPASGLQVVAHGGTSAANNSATGGAGGTGSSNTTHHNGGAGWTTTLLGGGGGGSGGSASAGTAATSQAGAAAVTGGGKGGAGATGTNLPGSNGYQPGGGGGGSDSAGSSVLGGSGGSGQITLTYTGVLTPFQSLIAHVPGPDAPPSLTPFVSTANTSDPPDGREYPVPSLVSGVNALFGGTYSIVLVNYYWDTPANARTVSVVVHQYEYPGGPQYTATASRSVSPLTDDASGNGIIPMGELTLPVTDIAPDNTSTYFTVGIISTDLSDQFLDVLFLDTMGQSVVIDSTIPGKVNYYLDVADTDRDLGRVLASSFDRAQATSVLSQAKVSGGCLSLTPGDNLLLAYCVEGAPALSVTYFPCWFDDRLT